MPKGVHVSHDLIHAFSDIASVKPLSARKIIIYPFVHLLVVPSLVAHIIHSLLQSTFVAADAVFVFITISLSLLLFLATPLGAHRLTRPALTTVLIIYASMDAVLINMVGDIPSTIVSIVCTTYLFLDKPIYLTVSLSFIAVASFVLSNVLIAFDYIILTSVLGCLVPTVVSIAMMFMMVAHTIRLVYLRRIKDKIVQNRHKNTDLTYATRAVLVHFIPEPLLNEIVVHRHTVFVANPILVDVTLTGILNLDVIQQGAVLAIVSAGLERIASTHSMRRVAASSLTVSFSLGMFSEVSEAARGLFVLRFIADTKRFVNKLSERVVEKFTGTSISQIISVSSGHVSLAALGGSCVYGYIGPVFRRMRYLRCRGPPGSVVITNDFRQQMPESTGEILGQQIQFEPIMRKADLIGYVVYNIQPRDASDADAALATLMEQSARWIAGQVHEHNAQPAVLRPLEIEDETAVDPSLLISVNLSAVLRPTDGLASRAQRFRVCHNGVGIMAKNLLSSGPSVGVLDDMEDIQGTRPRSPIAECKVERCRRCEFRGICDFHDSDLRTAPVHYIMPDGKVDKASAQKGLVRRMRAKLHARDPILDAFSVDSFPEFTQSKAAVSAATGKVEAAMLGASLLAVLSLFLLPVLSVPSLPLIVLYCVFFLAGAALTALSAILYSLLVFKVIKRLRVLRSSPRITILVLNMKRLSRFGVVAALPCIALYLVVGFITAAASSAITGDIAMHVGSASATALTVACIFVVLGLAGSRTVVFSFLALLLSLPIDLISDSRPAVTSPAVGALAVLSVVLYKGVRRTHRQMDKAGTIAMLQDTLLEGTKKMQLDLLYRTIPPSHMPDIIAALHLVRLASKPASPRKSLARSDSAFDAPALEPDLPMLDDDGPVVTMMLDTLIPHAEVVPGAAVVVISLGSAPAGPTPVVKDARLGLSSASVSVLRIVMCILDVVVARYRLSVVSGHNDMVYLVAMDSMERVKGGTRGSLTSTTDDVAKEAEAVLDGIQDSTLIELIDLAAPAEVPDSVRTTASEGAAESPFPVLAAGLFASHFMAAIRSVFRNLSIECQDCFPSVGLSTGPVLIQTAGTQSLSVQLIGRCTAEAIFLATCSNSGTALLTLDAATTLRDEAVSSGMQNVSLSVRGESTFGGEIGWVETRVLK
ncbi:hypothetical protein J8273_8170 [Carpediemonas membranifera]|uniref:Uncharacterized protein n=1 Tax=Carpediemonas membranifera TaxID=201153 RepID=A0A8J6B4Y4_9EUKA|nr:hypothetical protein J8273_8170 [Carpediemonas membranifera]|eukprot:KAG9390132.1 hypothetical protein J8273_8170 [Carpediemonas membranifera]